RGATAATCHLHRAARSQPRAQQGAAHEKPLGQARAGARCARLRALCRHRGHIPGSLNLPYDLLADPKTKTLLPVEEIEKRFRAAGLERDKPVVTSCGSGVTACALAFGLHLIGWPDAAVYDGSWSEWGLPGDTPVATGA